LTRSVDEESTRQAEAPAPTANPAAPSALPGLICCLQESGFEDKRAPSGSYVPVSRIIITMNPTIAAAVGRFVSLPNCDSGISSSMIT